MIYTQDPFIFKNDGFDSNSVNESKNASKGSFTFYYYRFLAFFDPLPPYLTGLLDKIYQIYSVLLTIYDSPIAVNLVCE